MKVNPLLENGIQIPRPAGQGSQNKELCLLCLTSRKNISGVVVGSRLTKLFLVAPGQFFLTSLMLHVHFKFSFLESCSRIIVEPVGEAGNKLDPSWPSLSLWTVYWWVWKWLWEINQLICSSHPFFSVRVRVIDLKFIQWPMISNPDHKSFLLVYLKKNHEFCSVWWNLVVCELDNIWS